MNTDFSIPFEANLRSLFSGNDFTSLDTTQYGEYVKGYTDEFLKIKGLDSNDDRNYYESLAETTLANYRKQNNYPRFVPTREQSSELFERFPDLSLVDNIDEREKKVDEWRNKSFEKASALRPAEREDIGVYLDALSNSFIRESASELNQTNWAGDKAYRFAEAFLRPVHELIDKPGAERAWSKIAPEDPNRDEDFSSMLASGFGQAGMQILTAAGLSAAGAPESIPYVFGAMFGAQYMKDGYYNEMRRSGDEDKAWDASVSQIPAAFLETIGDVALVRGVTKTARGYGKAFASATTEAEKRAVLREALPSMGKATMDGFIAEFAVGGMGAEFASGYGMYKATGNENYLRSFGEVFKSGLAEGIVGAVTSGSVHSFTSGNVQTRLAEDISVLTGFQDIKTKQEGISDALKRRDFDKVISLTNGQFVDPSQFDAHLEASDTLRGRATDENGEPVAKPREKNDTPNRVPVSSPISSKARGKLLEESVNNDTEIAKLSALPSRTEEEEKKLKSLTERNNYVKGVIESINNKTYQNPTEIDLTFDDSNDAFYDGKESKEKPQRDGIHEVVLDNGEVLNSDGAVVYFDQKFQQDFNTAVAHYGKENVSIKRNVNGNTANIYINKDGKWIKTNAEASYGINPSKGSVPVSFIENEDSKSVKVKFHPTVKDSTRLPANFTILEDTGDSVKVKHNDGRVFTFTGDRAVAAREMNAKREEKKQEKENKKKKTQENTNPGKAKDSSGNELPSLLDDSETGQIQKPKEEKFTQKKVNQSDPMSVLVDEELKSLSNNERRKLTPGRFERQSLAEVADKGVDLWHEGKRGRVKKDATTGRFYFEADDKTQIELNGNAESSLASVGITKGGKPGSPKEKVSLTSKTEAAKPEKKQSHKTLISSLKEKLDQIHHDSIDRLNSISGIINKLISLGVEYRVMSQEEIAKEYGENNSPGFATSDGKIVFNLDALNATNKHDLLFKILAIHESAHAGIYIVAQQNPELYAAAKENLLNNKDLLDLAREEYGKDDNGNYRFDSINQDGIFHETIRMIIEGRLTGRTTGLANSGPLKSFLQKLIDYIRNVMWRTSDRIVFQFVKNVEDVIGVTNSAIKIYNENITVNEIPANIISDFVKIINGEDVDLERYTSNQLRDLADLMRIKRDRPYIKERLLSRIKEYKPVGSKSNVSIINAEDKAFAENPTEETISDAVDATPALDNIIEESLNEEEKTEAATELGLIEWNDEAKSIFASAFADWKLGVKSFSEKLVNIFNKIINGIKIASIVAFLSITPTNTSSLGYVAFNQETNSGVVVENKARQDFAPVVSKITTTNQNVEFPLDSVTTLPESSTNKSIQLTEDSKKPIVAFEKSANLNNNNASDNVKSIADWVVKTEDTKGRPFIVADKHNGLMYIFDKDGNLVNKQAALYGAEVGDVRAYYDSESRVTPSGRFDASITEAAPGDYAYGKTLDFKELDDATIAIHRVYLAVESEQRDRRLASDDSSDNRVSHGCVNVSNETMDNTIVPLFSENGGVVYVVPETQIGKTAFNNTIANIVHSQPITNENIRNVARHTELENKFNNGTITPEETAEALDLVDTSPFSLAPKKVSGDFFQRPGVFYRVIVGADAFQDILQSGEVRTNAGSKTTAGASLAEKLAARPTAFPSFSKDSASMSYAKANPNHFIIVTTDSSIQPSTAGRHSAGKTHFPTDAQGNHLKSLSASKVSVYRHIGNDQYRLIYDKGNAVSTTSGVDNAPFSTSIINNSQPINIGDKFSFRLANELRNAQDTLLGLKIANDRTLPVQNIIAKVSKSGVNEFEVETLTNLINSLEDNGRVNIDELSNLVDNEPTVVINTLDFGGGSVSRRAELEHKFDTINPSWREIVNRGNDEEMNNLPTSILDNLAEWMEVEEKTGNQSATGHFYVDPYSNEVLSGAEIEPGHRLIWSGDLSLNIPLESNPIIRQKQIDNFEQVNAFAHEVKFTSQHYNRDVADNQLAFVRGGIHEYQKGNKLPDGTVAQDTTRIFEIWEVQSDWQGKVNKELKDLSTYTPEEQEVNRKRWNMTENIPLLKYWESLALKAAVNHAKKQGASNIIISDAETTMMTEEHDNLNYLDNNVDDNQIIEKYPLGYLIPIGKDGNVTATISWSSKDIIREDTGETVASLGMGNRLIISGVQTLRNPGLEPKLKEIFGDNLKLDKLEAVYSRPAEEKGMRAAYDNKYYKRMSETDANKKGLKIVPNTTDKDGVVTVELRGRIPKGLELLTNSKGKKVNIGEHNKGPSKVFKNPDGTPKNTNTGLMFPVNNNVELQFSQPITNENISDQNSQITNENITEEEVIDLTSLSGESVSTVRKNQIKRINELRKRKIEAKLGPEEKSALSILKGIKALAALPDESLEKYANLMEDFIDTRSRSSDAAIERIPIEEFLSKVHELDSEAKHAWFKQQQEDFPELQGKDFDKDYNGEMDQVKAAIDSIQENDKTIGIDRVNKNREMYLDKIDALRDLIIDNIDDMKDNMLRRIDDVSFNKTDSQHLKAGTWLMQDTMDDLKQYFEDYLNSILTIDVSQSSSKDIRKTYYSLMGVAYDGYMLSANNFISSDIMSMLQNDATPLDVFSSKNKAELVTKVMSISAQMRSTMDTKGYEILNRIAGKFRESIKKSHMFQQNALIPYQKESIDKAQERSGFHYSDTHLQKIGIYALSRRIRVSENPKAEIKRNLKQLKDSVINLSRSADKTLNNASEWYNKFIDGLFSGVLESETPLQKLEENASIIGIDDGMKGYVNDIVSFFDHFKPIARFTTEFIYGREFKDEHNYVPSMILNLNPVSGPMQYDVDDLRFDMTSYDIAERNVNVSGLSGTYDRKAQLKQNQAMVFNINHLFSNRGRLNFLDSLSAVPRREIAALFRQDSEGSKAVKSFMHDEHGSKFRYHTLENAFRTMWKNEIESTQYLHEYQGFVNGILSRWAGVVLSSAYQGVGQLISNIAPFITVNIANPGKIMDMFSAFSYAAKYRAGMLTEAQSHLYERLMFDLKNRHQDQVLDTSVNLGITKDSTWQAFKASAAAQGLSKVDKFVEKAKFFQFQEADFWSGAPMMMAEYLHQEKKRLGHDVKMEDLIYNEGSYFNAIDETERFIGIGNASRRGEWLTNRNSLATIVRHILTGFAGHRLNNASNAYIEFRKILSNDVSQEEKTKSAAYIGSIAVQSAVFTAAKVFVVSNLMSLISSIIKDKDDDDEELQKLLSKASKANAPEKKLIEAEISKRKEIRKTWEAINRRQDNSYLMTMNLTKDIVSNIFIWPNVAEPVADVFIYSTADAFEEKTFKEFKKKKLEELTTKMRNARNIGDSVLANRLRSEIASLSSQQAVKVTMPNQGSLVPFNGMYGGAFRNVESVFKAMRDSYLGVDEFNINDFANLATVFGWSTADILRYTRVAEDLDRAETDYREKVNPTGKNK